MIIYPKPTYIKTYGSLKDARSFRLLDSETMEASFVNGGKDNYPVQRKDYLTFRDYSNAALSVS